MAWPQQTGALRMGWLFQYVCQYCGGVRNEKNIWLTSWPFQNDWIWSPNRHHSWLGSAYRRTKRSRAVPYLHRAGRPQSPRWWPAHEPPCSVHALQPPLPTVPAFHPGPHLARSVHSNTNGQNFKSWNCVSLYVSVSPPDTYLLTHLLTPWNRVLLEKLTAFQLVKKFPALYGTWRFISTVTSARHLPLSWASSIQSITPHPTSWRSMTPDTNMKYAEFVQDQRFSQESYWGFTASRMWSYVLEWVFSDF